MLSSSSISERIIAMVIKDFDALLAKARQLEKKTLAVAAAEDETVLEVIKEAKDQGYIQPILVGDQEKINELAASISFDLSDIRVVDAQDLTEAAQVATKLVHDGEADILMKGLVDTGALMKAVLDKENGLRTGRLISHAALMHAKTYPKAFLITDAAMNIAPDAKAKYDILHNALDLLHAFGYDEVKVAVIAAAEKVSKGMQATLDAQELKEMTQGEEGFILDGPFALDNAISAESAEIKGIESPVAGDADLLLMPNIEAGNVFYKSLTYFAEAENAGLILGAAAPIVLTSRADNAQAKFYSIIMAMLHAEKVKNHDR